MKNYRQPPRRRRAPPDDVPDQRYGHDPADRPTESPLQRFEASLGGQVTTDPSTLAGTPSLPAQPARKPLIAPPGAKWGKSGGSFGFLSPPDVHNPKIRR